MKCTEVASSSLVTLTAQLTLASEKRRNASKEALCVEETVTGRAKEPVLHVIVDFPFLVLLISGGHSLLALVRGPTDFRLLGESRDDAPGEALDKVARYLKLRDHPDCQGFSGGRAIEHLAKKGDPKAFPFPFQLAKYRDCSFSFSGLKDRAYRTIIRMEREYG
ncbi:unnamed protein product [Notodromas monacha]|uniref:N(6)-L-threonylcarbamoyladenine synthase n=1 Tax=Notodromas monacha TaxID=399045 RepID=A0A7R9BMT3_9CRUS|nr:unnamed protein product [Notodromas monacha]CAG0918390.1 unnamed protein product [Notodromas monacha]